jgi:hypothetical protein
MAQTVPYLNAGPSVELRGVLGDTFAISLRTVGGYNIVREGFRNASGAWEDPPLASGRLELVFSWLLHRQQGVPGF